MSLYLLKLLMIIVPVFIGVAFFTLLERKLLSLVGIRMGPNKVSLMGFLQPLGDALKLFNKEINNLSNYSYMFHYSSAFLMIMSSIFLWNLGFCDPSPLAFKFSMLCLMLLLGLNSMTSILAGWSTFSKYSLIGSLRTVAQLVSYEASLYMCLFFLIFIHSSFSIYHYQFDMFFFMLLFIPFCFYIWIPSFLAELNRTPYDFSEGESELVSGFNTEFGSSGFTILFLSEYANIMFFCMLTSYFFFSSGLFYFFLLSSFFVVWIRSVLPRYRYDKLMSLSWKFFIPFLTVMFIFFIPYLS